MISRIPSDAFGRCGVDGVTNPSLKSPGAHHTNETQLLIQTCTIPCLLFIHQKLPLHPRDAPAAFLEITHKIQGFYFSCIKPEPKLLRGTSGWRPRIARLPDMLPRIKPSSVPIWDCPLPHIITEPLGPQPFHHWCWRKHLCTGDRRNKRGPACVLENYLNNK